MDLHIDAEPDENGWYDIKWAKAGTATVFDTKKGIIHGAYLRDNSGRASYGYHNNDAYNVTHFIPAPKPPVNSGIV